jgi:hypothetical protein
MPLTAKGTEIKKAMEEEYGAKKGEQVFYASRNKGTIKGVDHITVRVKDGPVIHVHVHDDLYLGTRGLEEDAESTGKKPEEPKYNAEAVNKEIAKDPRIKGKEARAIHALLKGRH